jgi:hypothetical protein
MRRLAVVVSLVLTVALNICFAGTPRPAAPDLRVRQFLFPPGNDKALRVQIANHGNANAGSCVLRLTVRKIKGTPVGRTTEITVPALDAMKTDWLVVDCTSILPKDVALKDTTFKLNVDVTNVVAESNEGNNEKWHNL